MPNWVYNNLTIAPNPDAGGTIKDVAALVEQVGATYSRYYYNWRTEETELITVSEPFSFWNIVRPEGEDLQRYNESAGKSGAMPFWYDWNCDNWGTKWDASEVSFIDHSPDHKQYTFSTAWAPPLAVLVALSAQHPNLHIELEWEEEQGFGGTFIFRDGEASETNYYDIPGSHADYLDRDQECSCEAWGEKVFSDCPIEEVPEDSYIPDDELIVEQMV